MQMNDERNMVKLFEYLRKIDKIIMHSIGCMPVSYQYKAEMQNIVYLIFNKIAELNTFLMNFKNNRNVSSEIEKSRATFAGYGFIPDACNFSIF